MGRPITNRNDIETVLDHCRLDPSGCWIWTGYIQSQGYGQIEVAGKLWLAHRFSWAIHHNREPDGLVLHRCDTPPCVNPEHLVIGNHKDNHQDAVSKGRIDPMRIAHYSRGRRVRKLTDDMVREIRTGKDSDAGYAIRYKVSRNTVCNIRNGRSKRLVPD